MGYEPQNPNGQATSANSSPAVLASDQPPISTILTSSATAAALGLKATMTAYGNLRVTQEPAEVFSDIFNGAVIDVTNRWNTPVVTGMTVTQANGTLQIGTTTVNSDSAVLDSIPTFNSVGLNFLAYGCAVKLEAQTSNFFGLNKHRFIGFGDRPASYNTTTPLKNSYGFEIDILGQLRCVVYSNGTSIFSTALSLTGANLNTLVTPSTGYVRLGLAIRADVVVFYVNSTEIPAQSFSVSSVSFALPDVQSLPIRIAAVNTPSGTVTASTFQVINLAVGDTGNNTTAIKDGTFAFRKTKVDILGNLNTAMPSVLVTGQAGQTASGQNILLATAGTGNVDTNNFNSIAVQIIPTGTVSSGVVTFEGSNDGVTFVAVPLYDEASLTSNPVSTVSPATGVNRYFLGPVYWKFFRARISTVIGGGGTIGAVVMYNQKAFQPDIYTVTQATAANLNATAIIASGTVTTVTTVGTVTTLANGQTAHSTASTGSPVRIGGRVKTAVDTTLVAGDASDIAVTTDGSQIMRSFAAPELDWSYASIAGGIVNTTDVVLAAAAGASIRRYITGINIQNASATIATEVVIKDGSTIIWRGYVGAQTILNSAVGITFPTPLKTTANAALNFACITTAAQVYVNAQGYNAV